MTSVRELGANRLDVEIYARVRGVRGVSARHPIRGCARYARTGDRWDDKAFGKSCIGAQRLAPGTARSVWKAVSAERA